MFVLSVLMGALAGLPALDRLDGLSTDVLFWLRHHVTGAQHTPAESRVVVVAFDEETYRTPPFAGLPKVLWSKQFAAVQDALIEGGAAVD